MKDLSLMRTPADFFFLLRVLDEGIANSVLLYDVASGEGKLVNDVVAEVQGTIGIEIRPRPIPSTTDIVEAGYQRAVDELLVETSPSNDNLISYVRSRLLTTGLRSGGGSAAQFARVLRTVGAALARSGPLRRDAGP